MSKRLAARLSAAALLCLLVAAFSDGAPHQSFLWWLNTGAFTAWLALTHAVVYCYDPLKARP